MLCAGTLLLEHVFTIPNGHDFIRPNIFRMIIAISCIVFCIINLFKSRFKLVDTRHYLTSGRLHQSNDQLRERLPLHTCVTKLDVYLNYFKASVTLQKHQCHEQAITDQGEKRIVQIKLSRLHGMLHWTGGT
jgi:hypothetical protein